MTMKTNMIPNQGLSGIKEHLRGHVHKTVDRDDLLPHFNKKTIVDAILAGYLTPQPRVHASVLIFDINTRSL